MGNSRVNRLISELEAIQTSKLWMGNSYDKKLKSINDEEAFTQPNGNIHSVAQILSHICAWKEDAILKIENGRGELMDTDDRNWPSNESLIESGWAAILKRFKESHEELLSTLSQYDDSLFVQTYYDQDFKADYPMSFMLDGLLHHDIYHLGQIGLIIGMIRKSN